MPKELDVISDEDAILILAIALGDLARRVRRKQEARRRVDDSTWAPPIRINLDDDDALLGDNHA